jgi:hypothetical protein
MKNIGVITNTEKDKGLIYTKQLIESIQKHGGQAILPTPSSNGMDGIDAEVEEICNRCDLIICLGGDGTFLKTADGNRYKSICHTIREDGAFVEAGENDNLIVQKLEANPSALGIFGFSFLDQNTEKVKGAAIDGAVPSFESIADGGYPISRPLYFYVKKAHVGVIPGLREFLLEFTSERAWGDDGYLSDRGLIPMPEEERRRVALSVRQ